MIIRAPRPTEQFTQIRNDVLRDQRLSYRASGILDDILSRPDNWRTNTVEIAKARPGKEGREAVRTAVREIETVGYIIRKNLPIKQAHGGVIVKTVMYVYDTPEAAAEAAKEAAEDKARKAAAKAAREAAEAEQQTLVEAAEEQDPDDLDQPEADPQPEDGFLGGRSDTGGRETGHPVDRSTGKAAAYEHVETNTENTENTARGDVAVEPETTAVASDRARAETDPAPQCENDDSARAKVEEGAANTGPSLFESAGSPADAGATPPDSVGPPRRRAGPAGADDPDFVRFWSMAPKDYPNHDARKDAYVAWRAARKKATAGQLLAAWEEYTAEWATWPEADWRFVPAERNWLARDVWAKPVQRRRRLTPVVRGELPSREEIVDELRVAVEAGYVTPERLFPRSGRRSA